MKKVIFPLLTLGLVFSGTQATHASTESPTQEATTSTSSTAALNSGGTITPMATVVRVDKPIAAKGTVTNYQLGQLINHYENYSSWLSAVNTVLYAGGVSSPAGVANSLATSFGGDGIAQIREAYYSGQNMYWVSVYASGVNPSLTTIYHRTFGNTPITYIEDL
ncbi:hypothetical protein [Planococcus sp. ISL-110]|uniref:hypothetical protein n=1 Tax=Planococcus sp. ISL-110 TaxID=2819167 RepID=UPI001BE7C213|nr:hypothetical protein [Planococcus sp. ISL-110]MBT2571991.1 hypothetical protein [Planococcus sp. ISL-110]